MQQTARWGPGRTEETVEKGEHPIFSSGVVLLCEVDVNHMVAAERASCSMPVREARTVSTAEYQWVRVSKGTVDHS